MSKITVAYWSGTGNTEAMAEAVGEGIKAAGKRMCGCFHFRYLCI